MVNPRRSGVPRPLMPIDGSGGISVASLGRRPTDHGNSESPVGPGVGVDGGGPRSFGGRAVPDAPARASPGLARLEQLDPGTLAGGGRRVDPRPGTRGRVDPGRTAGVHDAPGPD